MCLSCTKWNINHITKCDMTIKGIFTKEKSAILKTPMKEPLEKVQQNKKRHGQLLIPRDFPTIQPREFNLETGPPK